MADIDNRGLSAMGATFAERKAAREAPATKQVDDESDATENKAVGTSETKGRKPRKQS
jgi:hypothetical protein